jgi:nitrogen regulatory protein P-II 1
MDYKRIVVIIPIESLGSVEKRLHELHVGGLTVSRVRGYGEHRHVFSPDLMSDQAKLELFVEADRADAVMDALVDLSRNAPQGAGIAAVIPVERFVNLRTGTDAAEPVSKGSPQGPGPA